MPNILFVTLDDLGWSALPAYGNPYIETPAIDALAGGGAVFLDAFVVSSSCSPSRGVFLTGQYPHTNGLFGLQNRHPELAIPSDSPTLPKLLAEAGYACGIQGKWHVSDEPPTAFGFHEFLNDATGSTKIATAEQAIDFIHRHGAGPFFLELDFVEPHLPWEQHEGLRVEPDAISVLDDWMMPDWPEIREVAAAYFSEIRHVDRVLSLVLDELARLELTENTLIVVTSDNGAPFPGNKTTLYDRGLRAPLIVHWPAVVPRGVQSTAIVSLVDLPQALAIAATSRPADFMQGDPGFFSLLADPAERYRDGIYAEMTYHRDYCPARAVRTARWKYIRNLSEDAWGLGEFEDEDWAAALLELPGHTWLDPRPPAELYDVRYDPFETVNVADDPAFMDVRESMHERMIEFAASTGDTEIELD